VSSTSCDSDKKSRKKTSPKSSRKTIDVELKGKSPRKKRANAARKSKARKESADSSQSAPPKAPSAKALRSFRAAGKRNREVAKKRQKAKKATKAFLAKPPRTGRRYALDLRIHSPGTAGFFTTGGVDAAPALVRLARVKGLDVIAITDYYNAEFVDEVRQSASKTKLVVIPGFDMRCTLEDGGEVFAVALFPENCSSEEIFAVLDELDVPQHAYGSMEYVIEYPFHAVLGIVEAAGGVVIPSHVDKTPLQQQAIPVLVERFGIHAFDLAHSENVDFFKERWPSGGFTFFSFSNANALAQIGSRIDKIKLAAPGFNGIKDLVERRESA